MYFARKYIKDFIGSYIILSSCAVYNVSSLLICICSIPATLFGSLYCSPSLSTTVRYVTLKGLTNKTNHLKKSTEMNVQIHAMALLDTGNEVNCLARGTGPQQESDHIYKGTVFSHNNSPDYDETMNIHLPADKDRLSRMHIIFMLYVHTYIHTVLPVHCYSLA